jgi:glycosyltransferase involved in cell wall biosynthesis
MRRTMSRILLVQPDAGGRISGGYLYNSQMAAHGAWELRSVPAGQLDAGLAGIDHDLVIADSIWLTEATITPFLRLQERGIRLAVMMHSFPSMIAAAESGQPPRQRPTPFEVETLERVGLMIVPGAHYARLLAGRALEVVICEPGIADAWRAPPRPRRGPCALVSVGAVTPRKGFRDVLEALTRNPPSSPFRWTVAGSLDVDPAYARQVSDLATRSGTVTLAGQLSPDEVRALVTSADVLVMPSYDENQPLVLLEAIAASVPPIAYAAGATAAIMTHGQEGLVAPIGDRLTLGRHLAALIDDEPTRFRMAQACWHHQRTLPTWPVAAEKARSLLTAVG